MTTTQDQLNEVIQTLRTNRNPARTHELKEKFWKLAGQWFCEDVIGKDVVVSIESHMPNPSI